MKRRKKRRGFFNVLLFILLFWFLYQAGNGAWTYYRLARVKARESKAIEVLKARKIIYESRKNLLETRAGSMELAKKRLGLLLDNGRKK